LLSVDATSAQCQKGHMPFPFVFYMGENGLFRDSYLRQSMGDRAGARTTVTTLSTASTVESQTDEMGTTDGRMRLWLAKLDACLERGQRTLDIYDVLSQEDTADTVPIPWFADFEALLTEAAHRHGLFVAHTLNTVPEYYVLERATASPAPERCCCMDDGHCNNNNNDDGVNDNRSWLLQQEAHYGRGALSASP